MDRRRWLLRAGAAGLLAHVAPARAQWLDLVRQHGVVLLIRHTRTDPGIGDPPEFRPGDCRTQRNLSPEGRAQARRLGNEVRRRGSAPLRVRSSGWCRCLDTARLAFGRAEHWPALDSFFENAASEPTQTAELRRALAAITPGQVEAWVTHQVNVTALTGAVVAMGELMLLRGRRGEAELLDRLQP